MMNLRTYRFFRHSLLLALSLMAIIALAAAVAAPANALGASASAPHRGPTPASATAAFHASQVMFIENVGQWDEEAAFQAWGGPGNAMWIGKDGGIWITLFGPAAPAQTESGLPGRLEARPQRGVNIKLTFENANPRARIEPFDPLDTVVSYFIGNEPDRWRPDVPVWGGVRYRDLYPGVDLVLTGDGRQGFLWRLDCRAGCDDILGRVRLRVAGAAGLEASPSTGLIIHTAAGDAHLPLIAATGENVAFEPRVQGEAITAPFGATEAPQSAANDLGPGLMYSTFLGGSWGDGGSDVAVDDHGRAYITGFTPSHNFPTTPGAFSRVNRFGDLFVAKLGGLGDQLIYATFIGGGDIDDATAIAVDAYGRALVTGETMSLDFPTTPGAFQTTSGGGALDAFFLKLSARGDALLISSYLGGEDNDRGTDIATTSTGEIFVIGSTHSQHFPTYHAYSHKLKGEDDIFITKFSNRGNQMIYGTYLGGSEVDYASSMVVGNDGVAYLTGRTGSSDFPTTALDRSYNGLRDAFVAAIGRNGDLLLFSTFLGGADNDEGNGIALDASNTLYVTGETWSVNFPVLGNMSRQHGKSDAFLTILQPRKNGLLYSQYWGGSDQDGGKALRLDPSGAIDLIGWTWSTDLFVTDHAVSSHSHGKKDLFIARILPNGIVKYSSYFGGQSEDDPGAIAVNGEGDIYLTGTTPSNDFPTTQGAFDTSWNGEEDAFVTRMDIIPPELDNVRADHDAIYRMGCYLDPAVSVIRADASDVHLQKVELYYRTPLDLFHWRHKDMTLESGHTFKASLTGFLALPISYYVKATDASGQMTTSSTRTLTVKNCSMSYLPLMQQ